MLARTSGYPGLVKDLPFLGLGILGAGVQRQMMSRVTSWALGTAVLTLRGSNTACLASAVLMVAALFLPEPVLRGLGESLPSSVTLKLPLLLRDLSKLI